MGICMKYMRIDTMMVLFLLAKFRIKFLIFSLLLVISDHNRVHATDVLHGVYYLSTQPIPGFPQVNPEGDMFQKHISSSESGRQPRSTGVFVLRVWYAIIGLDNEIYLIQWIR